MSLQEIRRFRADILKQPDLLRHIKEMHWSEVVELAQAHGYVFTMEESFKYFQEIHFVKLSPRAMTSAEHAAWKITGNHNALVDSEQKAAPH